MALEQSGEENTDPPKEYIYQISESAFPLTDRDLCNETDLGSQMDSVEDRSLLQHLTALLNQEPKCGLIGKTGE